MSAATPRPAPLFETYHESLLTEALTKRTSRLPTSYARSLAPFGLRERESGRTYTYRVIPERGEIEAYVATGEPLDKAGAYALQGQGRRLVTAVDGSETNVIGLPLEETTP